MRPRALARVLRACVSDPARDLWEMHGALARPAGLALVAAAERHGVIGHLWVTARAAPYVHPHVAAVLEESYTRTLHLRRRGLADLALLGEVLEGAGIPWAAVNGPILAETVYPRAELRSYRDVDVLVPPNAFTEARRALEAAGARMFDREAALLCADQTAQVHLTLPHGSLCNLHWHLLGDAELRGAFHLPTGALLRRTRRVVCGGIELAALDPVDGFLHLALDTCLSGADRLIRLKDLDQIVRGDAPSWRELVVRSRTTGSALAVAGMLELTREVLGTPVPAGLKEQLDPVGMWTRIVNVSRRLSPPALTPGGGSALARVAQATRPTLAASVRQLAVASTTWLGQPNSPRPGRRSGSRPGRPITPRYQERHERTGRLYSVTSTTEDPAA